MQLLNKKLSEKTDLTNWLRESRIITILLIIFILITLFFMYYYILNLQNYMLIIALEGQIRPRIDQQEAIFNNAINSLENYHTESRHLFAHSFITTVLTILPALWKLNA